MATIKYELIDLGNQHDYFTHIKVSVSYYKDGLSRNVRGYYMGCSPVRRQRFPEGYSTETVRSGDGVTILLAETTRNTKKQAEKVAEQCTLDKLNDKESWFSKVVDYVCRKHNLHITECALKEGEFIVS